MIGREPSFNGAAPARARNGSMPRLASPRPIRLQRGRARAGAEWSASGSAPARPSARFNGAAPARARNAPFQLRNLQPLFRFNGAAPARARNEWAIDVPSNFMALASTGPRPRGRGMWNSKPKSQNSKYMLQRGRARAGAECRQQCPDHTPRPGASTGPRPRGRGMAPVVVPAPIAALGASTGPRPRGRGMRDRLAQEPRKPPCFNGAAPARARNALAIMPPVVKECFNGAAPARARNDQIDDVTSAIKFVASTIGVGTRV